MHINDTLTKDENLALAEKRTAEALVLIDEVDKLKNKLVKFLNPITYGLSPTKKEKALSIENLLSLLRAEHQAFYWMKSSYAERERMEKERLRKVTAETDAKNRLEESQKKVVRAIEFCAKNGCNDELTFANAIQKANEIRFEQLEKEPHGGPIAFDGQNCDDCSGWIPGEHRCVCGNRRVSWTFEGDFEDMYLRAEAY